MSTKHTPGPWWVEPSTSLNPSRAVVLADCVDIYDAPLTSETAGNAALIAAAPDLLAACKAMLSLVAVGLNQGAYDNIAAGKGYAERVLAQAEKDIARAEGKEK